MIEQVYEKVKSFFPPLLSPVEESIIDLNIEEGPNILTKKITARLNSTDRIELIEKKSKINGRLSYELRLYIYYENRKKRKIEPRRIAWASGVKIELFCESGEVWDYYVAKITLLSDYADERSYLNRFKAFFEMFELILSFIRQEVDRVDNE